MSDKSKICQSCGRFSEEGWAILEDNTRFWTCPRCMLREVTETVQPDYEAMIEAHYSEFGHWMHIPEARRLLNAALGIGGDE